MKWALCLSSVLALSGCASEWRTQAPVTPTSYAAPSYRSPSSVGRLARLAVPPARVDIEADEKTRATPEWAARRAALARDTAAKVAEYLSRTKGYDAFAVAGADGRWRSELAAPPGPPDLEQLEAAWSAVSGADDRLPAAQAIGAAFGADGVVLVERWIKKPWTTGKAIANIVLLNALLFSALADTNARVSIYESASGSLVWRGKLTGEISRADGEGGYVRRDVESLLQDLENAVPAQLRR
jgi:hypothetical protein